MITRYALFQGTVAANRMAEFKDRVETELLPTWMVYPGAAAVRVAFTSEWDGGAPEVPLVLAIDFPTKDDLERALRSQERLDSRAATERVLPGLFEGNIFHYVTESNEHLIA